MDEFRSDSRVMEIAAYLEKHGLTDRALARRLGVSDDLVRLWRLGSLPIGAKRVLAVEAATGIPRYRLRPDLYPPPKPRKRRAARPFPAPAAESEAAD
jgi:DNA-binding transcriptional regulator YdaS (Cro superfamily)